jgi:hypothetical protein
MFSETNPTPTLGRRIVQTPHQSQRPKSMSGSGYPKFRNDHAVVEIRIGVREFNCIGVSPPLDHPHATPTWASRTRFSAPIAGRGSASIRGSGRRKPIRRTACSSILIQDSHQSRRVCCWVSGPARDGATRALRRDSGRWQLTGDRGFESTSLHR